MPSVTVTLVVALQAGLPKLHLFWAWILRNECHLSVEATAAPHVRAYELALDEEEMDQNLQERLLKIRRAHSLTHVAQGAVQWKPMASGTCTRCGLCSGLMVVL